MDIEISTDKLSATKSRIMVPSYFITFSNMNCYCHLVSCLVFMWYSLIQYKGYNSKLKIFDGVQFRKYFISLPAFYLIIWLMKSPKSFEKIAIFSKFFGNFMSHIIRLNAGKRIKHFLNFSLNRK